MEIMRASPEKQIVITNTTKNLTVCSSGMLADTSLLRLFGLLGKKGLDADAGLLIKPSSGVHTFGMAFPIDIVSLDKHNRVLGTWESIGPWKVRGVSFKTASVLELASGKIRECGIAIGDKLAFQSAA